MIAMLLMRTEPVTTENIAEIIVAHARTIVQRWISRQRRRQSNGVLCWNQGRVRASPRVLAVIPATMITLGWPVWIGRPTAGAGHRGPQVLRLLKEVTVGLVHQVQLEGTGCY